MKEKIARLHETYQSLTGHTTALESGREHCWWQWLQWRKEEPFNESDLATVIGWIIKEFKAERRHSLSILRFTILIGQPETFEELLDQIRAEQRAKTRPNPLRHLRRTEPETLIAGSRVKHVSEVVQKVNVPSLIEQMRKAVENGA